MDICHGEAVSLAAAHLELISTCSIGSGDHLCSSFGYRVSDFYTVCVLGQVLPGVAPSIVKWKNYFSYGFVTGHQLYSDGRRTDTVLVIVVFPNLCYRNRRCFGRIGIGDGFTVFRGTSGYFISIRNICRLLRNRIGGFLAVNVLR